MMPRSLCLLVAGATLAGCAQSKAPVAAQELSVTAADSSAIATLVYGQTSAPVTVRAGRHTGAVQFVGNRGDAVGIWVRSQEGDAVAAVVGSDNVPLAINDDADFTTSDSHVTLTLPADGTYRVVFHDFDYARASFTVSLTGSGVFSCAVDSDCVAVAKAGCCHNGYLDAIGAGQAESYDALYECAESNPICAQFQVVDTRVAICDRAAHHCAMIEPTDISCGGLAAQHGCPAGFVCQPEGPGADRLGHCAAAN
jgi:hypothetical protein